MPKHKRSRRHTGKSSPHHVQAWDTPQAFWCELVAYRPDTPDNLYLLGSRTAGSPRLAMRWLRWRALSMTMQLSEANRAQLVLWAESLQQYEHGMSRLAAGEVCALTWQDTDEYGETLYYLLTSRPMRTNPLLGPYRLTEEQWRRAAPTCRRMAACT